LRDLDGWRIQWHTGASQELRFGENKTAPDRQRAFDQEHSGKRLAHHADGPRLAQHLR
jgi:hypothetical protein